MKRAIIVGICLCCLLIANVAGAVQYQVHDLGVLGYDDANVLKINNSGQALVRAYDYTIRAQRYFFWENGQATEIVGMTPIDLNNNGQVIGNIYSQQAFGYWQNGVFTQLASGIGSVGAGNDSLQCTGSTFADGYGRYDGFVWDNGTVTDLGFYETPRAINNNGAVVGESNGHMYLWQNGTMAVLDDNNAVWCGPYAINDNGVIVGQYTPVDYVHRAFVWENGSLTALQNFSGETAAYDINNLGQIVGTAQTLSAYPYSHAVVWRDGTVIDLGLFNGRGSLADTINDNGWIGGSAMMANGKSHAIIWEPTVPEPSSILALLSGLGGLGMVLRRRTTSV